MNDPHTGIAHVHLATRDLADSRGLYADALGLPILDAGDDGDGRDTCVLGIGPSRLVLRADPDAPPGTPAEGDPRPVVDHLALLVEDMDAAYARLLERGVPVHGEPKATAIGHRNMQRVLVTFVDPNGFHIQLSQTIDPRPHLDGRKQAKRRMASAGDAAVLYRGIDHISTYCADFEPTRSFYRDLVGLEEFFHSTTREEGLAVEPGFGQSAYATGGTDVELATVAPEHSLGPGAVTQLGFWCDDLEAARRTAASQGVACTVAGGAVSLRNPDELAVQLVGR